MSELIVTWNKSDSAAIERHLCKCSARFMPPLETRVQIAEYADKLAQLADRCEAWHHGQLVGLLAVYLNQPASGVGFVSSVSVCEEHAGQGIGRLLLEQCKQTAARRGFSSLKLEVNSLDARAVGFYKRCGFECAGPVAAGFEAMIATIGVA